jgi:hypothetical protein
MMARVSVPFTEGHYYGREERPNTELAHNSPLPAGKFIVDINSTARERETTHFINNTRCHLFLQHGKRG